MQFFFAVYVLDGDVVCPLSSAPVPALNCGVKSTSLAIYVNNRNILNTVAKVTKSSILNDMQLFSC